MRRRREKRARHGRIGLGKVIVMAMVILGTVLGVGFATTYQSVTSDLPDIDDMKPVGLGQNTRIYDRDGKLLGYIAGVTNRTLRDAYEAAPRTYQAIARRATVADFKSVQRLQLGEAPQLEKVNEAGEFKRGSIGEAKETYRVETYGKVVGITRQVLINDDLDAFTRVPSLFGTAAATLESDVVWSIFTANLAMADGKSLFHAGHSNLAGTGTALDVANLAKARTAMSRQTGLDGKTVLNIRPTFLVVPTSLELAAEQLLAEAR